MVARVVSADDVLPVDQDAKLAELKRIEGDLTPKIRSTIDTEKLHQLDMVLGEENRRPIVAGDLPRPFTTGLVEKDGSIGRTVLIYPRPSDALWRADSIHRFVSALREIAQAGRDRGERPGRVAGSIPLSDDILSSIARDAPLASSVSFMGVIVVLVLLARRVSAYVIASLFLGVLWLAGATMYLGIRINFANFIAFPITFGIGVDYAANVMSRYIQDPVRDIRQAIRSTGGAVALCSLTTVIGYSSLLLAKNRALFLFGLVAVTGEIACLSAAIIALPAWLVFLHKRRAPAG
jgi:predicted exporter